MSGAEIALVEGLRVRVGSDANCDVVLADAALPGTAFDLDVSADAVSLVRGDDVKTLVPFEVFGIGTSEFVIGPADSPWEPLKRREEAASGKRTEDDGKGTEDGEGSGEEGVPSPSSESGEDAPGGSRGILAWCCVLVGLLAVVLAAVWFFRTRIAERCPKAESARLECVDWIRSASASRDGRAASVAESGLTLADIARQYGLILTNRTASSPVRPPSPDGHPLLKGNLARRTERMAIRSLAQSVDPQVRFELTDDETLSAAAGELLFVVTEGAIKAASATNGVVTLVGHAPSASSLERTIRALDADVKGVERIVTTGVSVGGLAPAAESPAFPEAASARKVPRSRGTKTNPVRDYPIAGILTKPYPMVVLNNGMRLVEGAQVADAVVERIGADRLVLRSGSTTFEWKP